MQHELPLPADISLVWQAQECLAHHEHFAGRSGGLRFTQRGGTLVVRGQLPSFYLKQLLQSALGHVDGVRRVDNRVDVVCPYGLSSASKS